MIRHLPMLMVLALASTGWAQLSSINVIDIPGAILTAPYGINDAGDIAGAYATPDQKRHGFVLRGGELTTIDYPGAAGTWAYKVNNRGDVGGTFTDTSNKQHGFVLSGGTFKAIDVPGADQTMLYGFNNNGDATGMYFANGNTTKHYGWALIGGRFITIDYPQPNDMSCGTWISDSGEVGGHVQEKNGDYHGYLWKDGKFTLIDIEGGKTWVFWDSIYGVNENGDMLATYTDARGKQRGALLRKGVATSFDVPGSRSMKADGMNRSGQVVGLFVDGGGVTHGFLARVAPASRTQLLTVDDDGAECPGGLATIQEAVAAASPGATILVCPGIYRGTVNIAGPSKTGLQLIATGEEGQVILQGDYTERDGFHLENVTNVLIRGFTVRDFGNQPTMATDWGDGNQIYLQNADYNVIEHNHLINGDMKGIMLMDSAHNIVQQNVASVDNPNLANCGIHVGGKKSTGNYFRQNVLSGNKMAGIMISGAGPGNFVLDNTILGNGRDGITNSSTDGTWIEGNRVSYAAGPQGTTPYAKEVLGQGRGISIAASTGVTVFDNRMRGNSAVDLSWDGKGENRIESNACETSTPAGVCGK